MLDLTVDDKSLPDAVLLLAPFAPEAEARIEAQVPNAAARTGDEARHLKLAAIALCAALVAPSMPSITSETVGPAMSVSRQPVDWTKRVAYLLGVFQAELDAVANVATPQSTISVRPKLFSLAPGRRGY
jgi:hypothetical protein